MPKNNGVQTLFKDAVVPIPSESSSFATMMPKEEGEMTAVEHSPAQGQFNKVEGEPPVGSSLMDR